MPMHCTHNNVLLILNRCADVSEDDGAYGLCGVHRMEISVLPSDERREKEEEEKSNFIAFAHRAHVQMWLFS